VAESYNDYLTDINLCSITVNVVQYVSE